MVQVTSPATTALPGRKNYQGFSGFSLAVADDEKVVFSTTLTEVTWDDARLTTADPVTVASSSGRRAARWTG
ncbi:hypothetical protein ACWEIJ_10930 [Lentzea sp. NPDC004789]|jgi:hypothetical protein